MSNEIEEFQRVLQSFTDQNEQNRKGAEGIVNNLCDNFPDKGIELASQLIMTDGIPQYPLAFMILNKCFNHSSVRWASYSLEQRDFCKAALVRGILMTDPAIRNYASITYANVLHADAQNLSEFDHLCIILMCMGNSEYSDENKAGFINVLYQLIVKRLISSETPHFSETFQCFIPFFLYIINNSQTFQKHVFEDVIACYRKILPFFSVYLTDPSNLDKKVEILNPILGLIENDDAADQLSFKLYRLLYSCFKLYYETIPENMEAISTQLVNSFQKQDPSLILPAVNFLRKIASYEYKLKSEDSLCHNISESLCQLCPLLINLVAQTINETPPDEGSGQINLAYEIVLCLKELNANSDIIFQFIVENFDGMISSDDWRFRSTSLAMLYCITSGPNRDQQIEFLAPRFINILGMIQDDSIAVKDSLLWIIEIIFSQYREIVTDEAIFGHIVEIIKNAPYLPEPLVTRVCDIANRMGQCFSNIIDYPLFVDAFPTIIESMVSTIDRPDAPSSRFLYHSEEALHQLIKATPESLKKNIYTLLQAMCNRITFVIQHFQLSSEQLQFFSIDQTVFPMPRYEEPVNAIQMRVRSYSILIYSIIKRIKTDFIPYAEIVIPTILALLESKTGICHDEALNSLTPIIEFSEHLLAKEDHTYLMRMVSIIINSLELHDAAVFHTCTYSINALYEKFGTELATEEFIPATQRIFENLCQALSVNELSNILKVAILMAIAEIIRSLKENSSPALPVFWDQLTFFQKIVVRTDCQLNMQETNLFCEAILNGYQAIVEVAGETEIEILIRNYRQITELFERMSRLFLNENKTISNGLKVKIIDYMWAIYEKKELAKRINVQLNKKACRKLYEFLSNDSNSEIQFRASRILNFLREI